MVNAALLSGGVWEGREAVQTNSHSCVIFYKWKREDIMNWKLFKTYLDQQDALFKSSTDEHIHASVSYEPQARFPFTP